LFHFLNQFKMKNIKFIFGIMVLCWLPLSIFGQVGVTQDRRVTFLHGLGGADQWDPFVDFFENGPNSRRMDIANNNYSSAGGFNTIAAGITGNFGSTSIAICHSMGGVIARRLDNTQAAVMGGIITVGSPMDGAPVANSTVNGDVGRAIGDANYALIRGPLATIFGASFSVQIFGNTFGALILPGILGNAITSLGNDAATLSDLKVGGSGIEADKNASPTNTPKISIWGNEDSPTHWNITDDKKPDWLNWVNISTAADVLGYAYLAVGITHGVIAAINWYNPYGWYNAYAAYQWYAGYDWIMNDSERIYNNLIGSDMVVQQCVDLTYTYCTFPDSRCAYTPQNWQYCMTRCTDYTNNVCFNVHNNGISDAFIPGVSQRGEGSRSWRVGGLSATTIEAPHMNHAEELQPGNREMTDIFDDIFTGRQFPVFRIDRR
jgi:pimeloyl-ACP methyl ester carboxylesterase